MTDDERPSVEWVRGGSALSALFPRLLPASLAARLARLTAEGAVAAGLALLIVSVAHAAESGVIAIFLTSAGLSPRVDALLDENRAEVYGERRLGANFRSALSFLAVFIGVFAAWSAAALIFPESHLETTTGLAAQTAALGNDTMLTRRFGGFGGILLHNAAVAATFCVVALFYRSLGALLALSWNAALWAVVLVLLVRRATTASAMSKPVFVALAWSAVLPHLLLEAAAYVTASLAAIFLSRAAMLYPMRDARFRSVARATARMLVAAFALLALAALAESTLPALVLRRLT